MPTEAIRATTSFVNVAYDTTPLYQNIASQVTGSPLGTFVAYDILQCLQAICGALTGDPGVAYDTNGLLRKIAWNKSGQAESDLVAMDNIQLLQIWNQAVTGNSKFSDDEWASLNSISGFSA